MTRDNQIQNLVIPRDGTERSVENVKIGLSSGEIENVDKRGHFCRVSTGLVTAEDASDIDGNRYGVGYTGEEVRDGGVRC